MKRLFRLKIGRSRGITSALLCAGILAALQGATNRAWGQGPSASDRAKLGLTKLSALLGDWMPTGAGVEVVQVEAPLTAGGANYFPDPANAQLAGDTIVDKTGSETVSTHATAVAQAFYGSNGVAPGVDNVEVYNANSWLYSSFLRTNNYREPIATTRQVINNSWVGGFASSGNDGVALATDVLRRLDYVVNRDQTVVVAGVNNGSSSSMPQILGNAYNVIAVGLSSGNSSSGPSTIDVAGRSKPDLVAPAPSTSIGTAWVSGASALLLDFGSETQNASRPEVIKAVLLAGAEKSSFDTTGATATTQDDWSHTPTQPLDAQYGAGQMNVYNSALILGYGEQEANAPTDVSATGWDLAELTPDLDNQYAFEVPAGSVALNFSAIATWNRQIKFKEGASWGPATLTPSLADVNLYLMSADPSEAFESDLIDSSVSAIDNVEHIYQTWLPAGHYEMTITTDSAADVALAWNTQLVLLGDATLDSLVDGADYTVWADNFLRTDGGWGDGDFNQDQIVDGADYTIWADHFSPAAIVATPEPSTALLALVGCACAVMLCRRPRA